MTTFKVKSILCECTKGTSGAEVCYILSYQPLPASWTSAFASSYGCSIVVLSGMDWDNDLTPWPAAGAPEGSPPFKGLASGFSSLLIDEIAPEAEKSLGITEAGRSLIGVSLSGLFAIWEWVQSDFFHSVASISGSFWYAGFTQWLSDRNIPRKTGRAYLSLGRKEPYTKVKSFKSVGENTAAVVEILQSKGIDVTFQWTDGTHYAPLCPRLGYALESLYRQ